MVRQERRTHHEERDHHRWVLRWRCGAVSVCKAKYCTLKHVFSGPYELDEDTYFLTPAGKVWPKGTGGANGAK